MPRSFTRLDRASNLNRTREQQQLLSQRGFTRIRVGNDGKSAAAAGLGEERHEVLNRVVKAQSKVSATHDFT
jgi:hypothetical protein